MVKKILIGLLVILVVIQAVRPKRNEDSSANPNHITAAYTVPGDIQQILQRACYDCHSNYTVYPWYTNIQPVGWWMQHHVDEGKAELNFSEFNSYSAKKKAHKMEEVAEMVTEGEMPLSSYTWIHKDAVLSKDEAAALTTWAKALQLQIEKEI